MKTAIIIASLFLYLPQAHAQGMTKEKPTTVTITDLSIQQDKTIVRFITDHIKTSKYKNIEFKFSNKTDSTGKYTNGIIIADFASLHLINKEFKSHPYYFKIKSYKHLEKFIFSRKKEIAKDAKTLGFKVIDMSYNIGEHLFSSKKINNLDELIGKKVCRANKTQSFELLRKKIDAKPVDINVKTIYNFSKYDYCGASLLQLYSLSALIKQKIYIIENPIGYSPLAVLVKNNLFADLGLNYDDIKKYLSKLNKGISFVRQKKKDSLMEQMKTYPFLEFIDYNRKKSNKFIQALNKM